MIMLLSMIRWFLILKMDGYLAVWFYKFHVLEKEKLI